MLSCPPGSAGAIASGSGVGSQSNPLKRTCSKSKSSEDSRVEHARVSAHETRTDNTNRSYVDIMKEAIGAADTSAAGPQVTESLPSLDVGNCLAGKHPMFRSTAESLPEPDEDVDALIDPCLKDIPPPHELEVAAAEANAILASENNETLTGPVGAGHEDDVNMGKYQLTRPPGCTKLTVFTTQQATEAKCREPLEAMLKGDLPALQRRLRRTYEHYECASRAPIEPVNRRLRVYATRRARRPDNEAHEPHIEPDDNVPLTATRMGSAAPSNVPSDRDDLNENHEPDAEAGLVHADANQRAEFATNSAHEANAQLSEIRASLAAMQAEVYTLRAQQGRTSMGEAAGTSYAAQANVARASIFPQPELEATQGPAVTFDNAAAPMTQNDITMNHTEPGEMPNVVNTELPPVSNGSPSTAQAVNMQPLREELERVQNERTAQIIARSMEALAASLSGHVSQTVNNHMVRPSIGARPSDIGLSEFSGATSKMATVIEPEFYPRLLLWLEESDHLLRNSGLPTVQQIRTLFAHLTGAARKQFTTRWRNLDFSSMTMTEAKEKIFALVPNHQTHFSRAAMDMKFSAANLASDLDRFALYASHGDLPVDGHHFWYRMIQEKLLEACPDLFRLAAEHFGKRVEFEENMNFNAMLGRFMDIVLAVQTELKSQLLGKRAFAGSSQPEHPKKFKAPLKDRSHDNKGGKTTKPADLSDDFTLARTLGMCFGCGELYPTSARDDSRYDKKAHDAVCKKKFVKGVVTDEFSSRIAKWRKHVNNGMSADEVKTLAHASRSKGK
jgi:hypothetical protein